MPCFDAQASQDARHAEKQELARCEAMLCAVMTILTQTGLLETVLDTNGWQESGVTKTDLVQWWKRHEAADAVRRATEQAERTRVQERRQLLESMTPQQRRLLGFPEVL